MSADTAIVVGGGIIGLACAHYLAESGHSVTVIDKGPIGAACSQGNCGMICPSHVLPLTEPGAVLEGMKSLLNPGAAFRIKPQLRLALYLWMLQFARRCNKQQMLRAGGELQPLLESSMAEYRQLFDSGLSGSEWKENGLLYVLQTDKGLQKFAATDALLQEAYGIKAREISGAQLAAFDPALRQDLAGAYFYDDDGSVRPDKLIHSWQQRLQQRGVQFVEQSELQEVHVEAGCIEALQTDRGDMSAHHYVFAIGAWSSQLGRKLGFSLPVEPGKGYSVTMDRPALTPRHPMLFPEHRVGVTPFDEGYRLGSMMEFAGFDSSIPERRIQQLRDSAAPYLREPTDGVAQETWYGWRPMTWDSLPVVGRVPGLGNGVLATGHNMLGLTLAPATGRLVAELVNEQAPHVPIEPYSPLRF